MGICDVCGNRYEIVKNWQKRCSVKCNSVAANARRRLDPAFKTCRTCKVNLPVANFQIAHRSCLACESLRDTGQKRCTKCGQVKHREDFAKRGSRPDGCESSCKACRSAEARERNAHPDRKLRKRDRDYRAKYGISLLEVEAMLELQEGRCAICGKRQGEKPFHVDHNHETGVVRSLLCLKCNALLGQCSEDPDILLSAINYLERHNHDSHMGP